MKSLSDIFAQVSKMIQTIPQDSLSSELKQDLSSTLTECARLAEDDSNFDQAIPNKLESAIEKVQTFSKKKLN